MINVFSVIPLLVIGLIYSRSQGPFIAVGFFWLLIIISYTVELLPTLTIWMTFISLSLFFKIIGLSTFPETASFAAYIFLLLTFIHLFYLACVHDQPILTTLDFFKTIYIDIMSFRLPFLRHINNKATILFEKFIFLKKKYIYEHPKNTHEYIINTTRLSIAFATIAICICIIGATIYGITTAIQIERTKLLRLAQNPKIIKYEPKLAYQSTKIVIYGSNFGWTANKLEDVKVMSKSGEINTDLWTNTMIVLTVPLSWQPGIKHIWIEKRILWQGKPTMVKSEIMSIRVLPRHTTFTSDDDTFFEQLKHLDKQTLEINGYE